ncbi:MAG TPA: L,D-transpeptidase family protein [Kiritimatiellia bacterium]|nr:L,D-transpeptidase family protein [Kiritimatiellia bacterium]HRZ11898.1 L,D-transpeptidase family protein [Kiritimatiellia bacterium]HSA17296.1 L,D-transpeptidase family protein [Kiritimatiellia bacterium]
MKDLYLRPRRSTRGCLIAVILLLLVILAAWWFWRRPKAEEPAPDSPAAIPATAAAPAPVPAAKEPPPAPEAKAPAPKAPVASRPSPAAADPGLDLLARARELRASDKLVEARDAAWQALAQSSNEVARTGAEALLNEVNIELLLSPRMMPEKEEYVVASGDSLDKLRKKFGTTVEVIRRSNRIPGDVIRAGDRFRIFKGRFTIQVSKSRNDLVLMMNDRFFKRYRVGTGEYGKTPTGDFTIKEKIAQPTWWRPDGKPIPFGDPENVLGTHWLSLDIPGYGIHGTWEPDTIGKQASAGCIRLLNAEVEELFNLVPEGTPVRIVE